MVSDVGRVGLLCKTRSFALNPVRAGAPVKDFEKPVIPAKFMLTPSRSPMALEIIISIGDCDRGFLNIAYLGPLEYLRGSGQGSSEAKVGNYSSRGCQIH